MNKPVFINLTNHLSKYWGEQQKKEAHKYGVIVDIPFPNVPAEATEDDIRRLCDATVKKSNGVFSGSSAMSGGIYACISNYKHFTGTGCDSSSGVQ